MVPYDDRRRRQAQGQAKAKAEGRYKGRPEDAERNDGIAACLPWVSRGERSKGRTPSASAASYGAMRPQPSAYIDPLAWAVARQFPDGGAYRWDLVWVALALSSAVTLALCTLSPHRRLQMLVA